ncbi:gamma-tubulin complex component 2 homolog [Cydia strobilella]|uniref:gamma-tubulin complex component 2 homolog n=1 Tax=Cydia strobilella TaxID=1100964 RepID=UPI0030077237
MCVEVIEPSWCQLIHSLEKVNNVDEVLERHSDFLEQCLGDCMLTSPQLLKAVTTLCQVCVQFCAFIQEMHKYFVDAELNSMLGSSYDSSDCSEVSEVLPMSLALDSYTHICTRVSIWNTIS